MENLNQYIRELFVFQGRIGRWRFIQNYLVITVFTAVAQAIFAPSLPILLIFPMFISLVMQAANAIKRLQDREWPWFCIFIFLVPVANVALMALLLLMRGTVGPNKYGNDPIVK